MPRTARIVVPGVPHHVTQRGNRRQSIFFSDDDRRTYLAMLADACREAGTRCFAWCLMDNHVHLVLQPISIDDLRAVMSRTHTRYAQRINRQHGLDGHVFQGRFGSRAMDPEHLMRAVRYVENNPVAAGLVASAGDWPWSSAQAHLHGSDDGLTDVAAIRAHIDDWEAYLAEGLS